MASPEQLKKLEFLIGTWKHRSENQFGEQGVIEGIGVYGHDPSDMFIVNSGESRSNGKLVNKAVSYLLWDNNFRKYIRKSFFSYGWILNEVGELHDNRLVFDVVSIDGEPDFFKGTRWRSFIQKYSENEIGTGLEVAKGNGPFTLYGESRAKRIQSSRH